jgi:hypothetical protein
MMAVIRVILYLSSVGCLVASGYLINMRRDFHGPWPMRLAIIGLGSLGYIFLLERFGG